MTIINTCSSDGSTTIVYKNNKSPVSCILAASTFTSLTYTDNGGRVQLVSSGVHGLTASPAIGNGVYTSWSGGSGVGGIYKIISVDDPLKITIDVPYGSGFGVPTVAKANTEIVLASISLPPLDKNSVVELSAYLEHTASANVKGIFSKLNGSNMSEKYPASSNVFTYLVGHIMNLNNTALQSVNAQCLIGASANTIVSRTVETKNDNILEITAKPVAANEYVKLLSFIVKVNI